MLNSNPTPTSVTGLDRKTEDGVTAVMFSMKQTDPGKSMEHQYTFIFILLLTVEI